MRPLYDCIKQDKNKADEMFEKLGYNGISNFCNNKLEFITYSKKELRYKAYKEWELYICFNTRQKYIMTKNIKYYPVELLQAINEKCKELGWLDKEREC